MASNLILIFGFLCAGAVADLSPSAYAKLSTVQQGRPGELRRSSCLSGKNNGNSKSPKAAVTESLNFASSDSDCTQCEAILQEIKDYIGNETPDTNMLFLACSTIQFTEISRCFYLAVRYGKEIARFLSKKTPVNEICTKIDQCPQKNMYFCDACQNYVFYDGTWEINTNAWEAWACSEYRLNELEQCKEALKRNQHRIKLYIKKHPNSSAYKVCEEVKLCPPQTQGPRHYYYSS